MTTHYIPLDDDDKQGYNAPDPTPPEMPLAFDQGHRPIAVQHPVYEEPEPPNWLREDRLNTLRSFLESLAGYATPTATAEAIVALQWLCNVRPFKSQREFAAFLGVTEGRASQIMAQLARVFPSMARLKKRQRKANR